MSKRNAICFLSGPDPHKSFVPRCPTAENKQNMNCVCECIRYLIYVFSPALPPPRWTTWHPPGILTLGIQRRRVPPLTAVPCPTEVFWEPFFLSFHRTAGCHVHRPGARSCVLAGGRRQRGESSVKHIRGRSMKIPARFPRRSSVLPL